MTKTYTMTNGEVVTYKELQIVARDFGIKANQKADVLITLIANAAAPVQEVEVDEFEQFANGEIDINESASEASAVEAHTEQLVAEEQPQQPTANEVSVPSYTHVFEFVRGNNLGVVFMQKGVQVKIGWNPTDAKTYIKVGNGPLQNISVQTAIDRFKKFKNGVHGDVARIVKALVRIRKMPAPVLLQLNKRKEEQRAKRAATTTTNQERTQENVSPDVRKENPSKARYSGTVDASWLAEFRHGFNEEHDRQPSGMEIKDAWLNRGA